MRLAFAALLLAAGAGSAAAGTNFPALADYPAANCTQPQEPSNVPEFKAGDSVAAYARRIKQHNDEVTQYNADLHQYTACMNAYVANAQADMDLIRDKVNKATGATGAKP